MLSIPHTKIIVNGILLSDLPLYHKRLYVALQAAILRDLKLQGNVQDSILIVEKFEGNPCVLLYLKTINKQNEYIYTFQFEILHEHPDKVKVSIVAERDNFTYFQAAEEGTPDYVIAQIKVALGI